MTPNHCPACDRKLRPEHVQECGHVLVRYYACSTCSLSYRTQEKMDTIHRIKALPIDKRAPEVKHHS